MWTLFVFLLNELANFQLFLYLRPHCAFSFVETKHVFWGLSCIELLFA